jgi:hypothetical protein
VLVQAKADFDLLEEGVEAVQDVHDGPHVLEDDTVTGFLGGVVE